MTTRETNNDEAMNVQCLNNDADALNKYISTLGFDISSYEFVHIPLYSLQDQDDYDKKLFCQPALAILVFVPFNSLEYDSYERDNTSDEDENPLRNPKIWFLKEGSSFACGIMALLNAFGNIPSTHKSLIGGKLQSFFTKCPIEMNQATKLNQFFKYFVTRSKQKNENPPDAHIFTLVNVEGILYQLDSMKDTPIKRGRTNEFLLLKDAYKMIQSIMSFYPGSLKHHFDALALIPKSNSTQQQQICGKRNFDSIASHEISDKFDAVKAFLNEAIPHLYSEDLQSYTSSLLEIGFDSEPMIRNGLLYEDLHFMKKAHARLFFKYIEQSRTTLPAPKPDMNLKVKLLAPTAKIPQKATDMAVGYDLYSPITTTIPPNARLVVPLGIQISPPRGYYAQLKSRSGLSARHQVDTVAGVIDADYTGDVTVVLQNSGSTEFIITEGDRISQLVLLQYASPPVELTDQINSVTDRGENGFGSTGQQD